MVALLPALIDATKTLQQQMNGGSLHIPQICPWTVV
ncbi:hypothetical protein LMG23992_00351 [Cupriavidus laharis]|uniref:Uncharacterized protein n=1 Tax=Cupriavidus laharis TaxID=151654 RepID=A0ABM8WD22_9BURK|nr:hypothetical protein LMG23992_00351 [Cupriavidus laharis]